MMNLIISALKELSVCCGLWFKNFFLKYHAKKTPNLGKKNR